jgi:hypothetical protein
VNPFVEQLDNVVKEVEAVRAQARTKDLSDVPQGKVSELITRACAAIERASGPKSQYSLQAEKIRTSPREFERNKPEQLAGVARSLSLDMKAGYLKSLEELIHGELFGDFLEMAQHLVESGYKDAAAVIAGSSLEAHLRQLAKRSGVPTEHTTARGIEPKKADLLNAELVKAGAYSALDQKNVTAWLGLRNKAAHGEYNGYQKDQVLLLIDNVRDFLTRHPA